jgi:hypothetical protein
VVADEKFSFECSFFNTHACFRQQSKLLSQPWLFRWDYSLFARLPTMSPLEVQESVVTQHLTLGFLEFLWTERSSLWRFLK